MSMEEKSLRLVRLFRKGFSRSAEGLYMRPTPLGEFASFPRVPSRSFYPVSESISPLFANPRAFLNQNGIYNSRFANLFFDMVKRNRSTETMETKEPVDPNSDSKPSGGGDREEGTQVENEGNPVCTSEEAAVKLNLSKESPRGFSTKPKKELDQISKDEILDDTLHIPEVFGRVHSFESFSAVDGPGVRSVVFLQGCLRRCTFCANPDTWNPLDNCMRLSSKNIANRLRKNLTYYEGGGGVTLSGGEPMMQPHFSAAIFKEAHSLNITTCLDTAGYGSADDWAVVLPHTDRVLLCLKAMDPSLYQEIVGIPQFVAIKFAKAISDYNVPLIIRWVLMAGVTDTDKEIDSLIEFAKNQRSLVGIEVLPYHNLGKNKWAALGLEYPLEGMSPPSKEIVERVRRKITAAGIKVMI